MVLDANVLFGALTTDVLISTAMAGLYQANRSEEILAEARRAIEREVPGVSSAALDRRFALMQRALPDAVVRPEPSLIAVMLNDPGDRHVLAAAVSVGAEAIVTENLRHFPASACAPHGVEAQSFDTFLGHLVSLDRRTVAAVIDEIAARRRRPPTDTREGILDALAVRAPVAVELLR